MRSSPTSPPERPDWDAVAGEVAGLVERVRAVALARGVDPGAVVDAVAEELAALGDLPLVGLAPRPATEPHAA